MSKYTERRASQKRVEARIEYDKAVYRTRIAEAKLRLAEAQETLARVKENDETYNAHTQVVEERKAAVQRLEDGWTWDED